MMMQNRKTVSMAAVALLAIHGVSLGLTIRLKSQVNAEFHQDVRLGDIATVTDAQPRRAEDLANTVIIADIDKPLTLKAETVLLALMSQRGTEGSGIGNNLQFGGSASCQIALSSGPTNAMQPMVARDAPPPAPPAASPPSPAPASAVPTMEGPAPAAKAAPLGAEGSLRETITQRLVQESGAPRNALQVDFSTNSPLVDSPISAGQRWVVRPLTRTLLGSVQFEAQLVAGTKTLQRLTVATDVRRLQRLLVTTTKIERGTIVTADKIRFQDAWLDRKIPTLLTSDKEAIGLEAQRDVDPGTQMDQRDFKPLLMARKGDLIKILYIAPPVQIELHGVAMADAKFHDQIDVRNEKTNETYVALLIKKNLGVVGALTAEQEKTLLEAP